MRCSKLDVPAQLDRAQGDVHAAGNPHIQTDPRNIARVAEALGARLQQLDPAHAADYAQRQADFSRRWQQAMGRWTTQAAPLKGVPVVSQHKAFVYLYDWLGLKEVAVLEPKPGVEPTASHLQSVQATLKAVPARMVLYAAYQDPRASEWLNRNAGVAGGEDPLHRGRHRWRKRPLRSVRRHHRTTARRRRQAMNWSALDWGILGPALIAGLLVLATHVPLGKQVLDRGIVFIDLAIAQIAGLGVIAADAVGLPEGGLAVQVAAICAALLGALLLTWTERKAPQQQEALIGVMFILAACGGILLLAGNPHGGEHLKELLVGQILWVNATQLLWLAGVTALLLAALWLGWVAAPRPLRLLRRLRARGDCLGATGWRVPGVREPDHSGACHPFTARLAAPYWRLCRGRRRLCAGPGAVCRARLAVRRRDCLDARGMWNRIRHDDARAARQPRIARVGSDSWLRLQCLGRRAGCHRHGRPRRRFGRTRTLQAPAPPGPAARAQMPLQAA